MDGEIEIIIASANTSGQTPRYPLPSRLLLSLLGSVLTMRSRSFTRDAGAIMAGVRPPPQVLGAEHIPLRGPLLVACNHFHRPGVGGWWGPLAITVAIGCRRAASADAQVHWITTEAWTYPPRSWQDRIVTPVTRWAFRRAARTYGFVAMPPMPPNPREVEARALAVLQAVHLARQLAAEGGIMGLAPEGRDIDEGLGEPPENAGRFMALLATAGLAILPVGVAEADGRMRLSFGPPFVPDIPATRTQRDQQVSRQVMAAIARQL
jgi:1-acyl-sn-glycerol-3-phosphate acyltransferase